MSGRRHPFVFLAALAVLAVGGCTEPGTEILLTVRSEFRAPQEVETLHLRLSAVDSAGGPAYVREETYGLGANPGEYGLPAVLSIRPGRTYDSRVDLHIELLKGAVLIAERDAVGEFVDGTSVGIDVDFALEQALACGNDPQDGEYVGAPCESSVQCGGGSGFCMSQDLYGFPGGYCIGQSSLAASCDPFDTLSCPTGATCIYAGPGTAGARLWLCADACAVAGDDRDVHRTHCDCRDGYECSLSMGVCLPGCTGDDDCCNRWVDANDDGRQDPAEVEHVAGCDGHCNPATARCDYAGASDAHLGSACTYDADCPANATCITESQAPTMIGGICVRERCDLGGQECDDGSGCTSLWTGVDNYEICARGCEVGTDPGDSGFRCEDDQACWPGEFVTAPHAFADADGYCWSGNWPGAAARNLYEPCDSNSDCFSPYGLGECLLYGRNGEGYCTIVGCPHPLIGAACAPGGQCLSVLATCVPECIPDVAPVASECPPGFACNMLYGTPGCYIWCDSNADCGEGVNCNLISHGCEWTTTTP